MLFAVHPPNISYAQELPAYCLAQLSKEPVSNRYQYAWAVFNG
jgi:hypothetical protein